MRQVLFLNYMPFFKGRALELAGPDFSDIMRDDLSNGLVNRNDSC